MSKSNKIQPFVWGAVAGAIAALLLAPKSGRELRKDIVKSAKTAGSKTAEYGRQAGAAAKTFAGKTATVASCVKEAANRIVTPSCACARIRTKKPAVTRKKRKPSDGPAPSAARPRRAARFFAKLGRWPDEDRVTFCGRKS